MLYHTEYGNVEAVKKGFIKCYELASASNKQFKIAVHTKFQFKEGNLIESALGEILIKNILKGPFKLREVTIYLQTERKPLSVQMPVLALHVSTKYLNKLIKNNQSSDLVYVYWTDEELKTFLKNHSSTMI